MKDPIANALGSKFVFEHFVNLFPIDISHLVMKVL